VRFPSTTVCCDPVRFPLPRLVPRRVRACCCPTRGRSRLGQRVVSFKACPPARDLHSARCGRAAAPRALRLCGPIQVSIACSVAYKNRNSWRFSIPNRSKASTTPSSNPKLSPNFLRILRGNLSPAGLCQSPWLTFEDTPLSKAQGSPPFD